MARIFWIVCAYHPHFINYCQSPCIFVDMATSLFWAIHLFNLQCMSHLFHVRKKTQIIVLKCFIENLKVNFKDNYFHLNIFELSKLCLLFKASFWNCIFHSKYIYFFTCRIVEFPQQYYNIRTDCRQHTKKPHF